MVAVNDVYLRIVNQFKGSDLQNAKGNQVSFAQTELSQRQCAREKEEMRAEGKREGEMGTGSSRWSCSSGWSAGTRCPATAAPARSGRTRPSAASSPPSPATRRGAAVRRGRGETATGGVASRAPSSPLLLYSRASACVFFLGRIYLRATDHHCYPHPLLLAFLE